jgi:hypothetical protein
MRARLAVLEALSSPISSAASGLRASKMCSSWCWALLVAASMLGGCGRNEPDEAPAEHAGEDTLALGVELDGTEQEKLGVELGEINAAQLQPSIDGPARVLDAQAVVAAMAELAKAEADSRTSQTALQRARDLNRLDKAVSAETLEAAERDAAAAEAQLRVARARAALEFGARAPWLEAERREPLLTALSSGATVLVSASFPSGLAGADPRSLTLRRMGAARTDAWSAIAAWPGPADPNVPGPTLLALLPAPPGVGYGERLTASVVNGPSVAGAVVPLSAVVLAGGEPWCYVQTDAGVFERRRVSLSQPLPQGYFEETGFAAGERVVVAGAGLLLAREVGGGAAED